MSGHLRMLGKGEEGTRLGLDAARSGTPRPAHADQPGDRERRGTPAPTARGADLTDRRRHPAADVTGSRGTAHTTTADVIDNGIEADAHPVLMVLDRDRRVSALAGRPVRLL